MIRGKNRKGKIVDLRIGIGEGENDVRHEISGHTVYTIFRSRVYKCDSRRAIIAGGCDEDERAVICGLSRGWARARGVFINFNATLSATYYWPPLYRITTRRRDRHFAGEDRGDTIRRSGLNEFTDRNRRAAPRRRMTLRKGDRARVCAKHVEKKY